MQAITSSPTDPGPTTHSVLASATAGGRLDMRRSELDECTCLLEVAGELDLAAAPGLKSVLGEWLERRAGGDLVIDLSEITHLDSTGLAVLVAFRRRLPDDARFALAAPSRHVTRLLALTGLEGAFDTLPGVAEAQRYLAEARSEDRPLPLSPDAAVVVGLASTALPFAECFDAEADRWARILLPYGSVAPSADAAAELAGTDASAAVPPLANREEAVTVAAAAPVECSSAAQRDRLDTVVAHAARYAAERSRCAVRTGDLVRGVMAVYGAAFDRALLAHG